VAALHARRLPNPPIDGSVDRSVRPTQKFCFASLRFAWLRLVWCGRLKSFVSLRFASLRFVWFGLVWFGLVWSGLVPGCGERARTAPGDDRTRGEVLIRPPCVGKRLSPALQCSRSDSRRLDWFRDPRPGRT